MKRLVQATLRWCISSPIESPRAMMLLSGSPPAARRASERAGARRSASQRSRFSTSSSFPPKRITFPRPSFRVQYARFPNFLFSTIITGIERVVMPVMGPTASK